MAGTKKKTKTKTKRVGKAPSLEERITDFSKGAFVGETIWTPRKKGKK